MLHIHTLTNFAQVTNWNRPVVDVLDQVDNALDAWYLEAIIVWHFIASRIFKS